MRLKIIRNELIKNVGKFQSCMVSKLRIIFKRIVLLLILLLLAAAVMIVGTYPAGGLTSLTTSICFAHIGAMQ